MSHFAKLDENNKVIDVLVVEQEFIDTGALGLPSSWVQTSCNTHMGEHKLGGTPLRKNFAGIGFTYDKDRDAFIPPKPYPSWILDEDTGWWKAPTYPDPGPCALMFDGILGDADGNIYEWDEDNITWKPHIRP